MVKALIFVFGLCIHVVSPFTYQSNRKQTLSLESSNVVTSTSRNIVTQLHSYNEPPRRQMMPPPDFDDERPDPSILIASRPGPEQQDAVFAISGGIVLGTILCVQLLNGLESALPKDFSCFMRDYPLPILLGVIFVAAGSSHFTMTNAFCNIVPYRGCWGGLWQVGSIEFLGLDYEEFHTIWTGIAEIAGGLFLIFSVFGIVDVSPTVPAALLGTLVAAITPANIFMFTHDAQMGYGIPPIPYPYGHVGRGVAQMVLLALFWKLTFHY